MGPTRRVPASCATVRRRLAPGKFRPGLRVKGIQGMPGCFEMTWEDDGRAIFTYGPEVRPGEAHIIWLAIGTHAILP
ncbi:MAG TPA: hypothetical protein DIU14_08395 [Actinobacteria bacterium]|nr:hypothetical protein [Actinomycetota bacterium]